MDDNSDTLNVIIADTQFLITTSLRIILEEDNRYVVKDIVSTQSDLQKALRKDPISLLILDFAGIDFDSLDDIKTLKKEFPKLPILVITNEVNKKELIEMNSIGITSIIYKAADKEELLSAIEATLKGRKYYSEDVLELLFELSRRKNNSNETEKQLTNSEIEIVRLISEGYTTKEIASRKHISFHTVMSHRKNIFRKLEVNSVSELIMYAIKAGYVDTIEYHI